MDKSGTQINRPKEKKMNDIDKLYVWRKEGGTGLSNIEDCVDIPIRELEDNIKKSKVSFITAADDSIGNISTD